MASLAALLKAPALQNAAQLWASETTKRQGNLEDVANLATTSTYERINGESGRMTIDYPFAVEIRRMLQENNLAPSSSDVYMLCCALVLPYLHARMLAAELIDEDEEYGSEDSLSDEESDDDFLPTQEESDDEDGAEDDAMSEESDMETA